jgi:cysteinyl-tRNA synthetase
VEETLKAGFDGIYMDWVEAFSDENVMEKAAADGVDPVTAMFDFIEKIRHYARNQSPHANAGYLVIAQNASDLYQEDPARYRRVIDAIALEAIWYDGTGGFDDWDDSTGYNVLTNEIYPGYTEEVLAWLEPMKAHMPIFCVEYAQDVNGQECASEVYHTLAPAHGFIPYCTRRSLARLSTTPYPFGYEPIDY